MPVRVDFTEEKLSALPQGLSGPVGAPVVSPSLNLVLYAASIPLEAPSDDPEAEEPEPRASAMANAKWGPVFASVSGFVCSDDGKLWAYVGQDTEYDTLEWLVVNHEKKHELGGGRPYVSPDGSAYACTQVVKQEKGVPPKFRVLVAGQEGALLQAVHPAGFSARGVFAYKAYDEGHYAVVAGGHPTGPYGDVQELQWSPEGGRLAYVAGDPGGLERYLVVDGRKGPAFLNVHGVQFSPDGGRVAYVASEKDGCRIVLDGTPGPLFAACPRLWFSADGRTLLSRVGIDKGWSVVVNQKAGAVYDEVGPPVFSRDAALVAYAAQRDGKSYAVVGGVESEPCDLVYRLVVGERAGTAFALREGKSSVLIHNGREVRRADTRPNQLAIGADGSSLAWSEPHGEGVRIVVNGEPGETFTGVDALMFAPDGRTAVYRAQDGDQSFVVVGRKRHGPMVPYTEPVFNAAGDALAVVAGIGREIWRKILPV